jgi:hypothetical protein
VGFGGSDCERLGDAWLAQPTNAITSLAFVAMGGRLLVSAARERQPFLGAAAFALVAVGAGSFAFHGPQPAWAGLAHDVPIALVVGLFFVGAVLPPRPTVRALLVPAAWFIAGLAAYAAGRSGSVSCRPDSWWQYHGVWHLLAAVALGSGLRRAFSGRGESRYAPGAAP